MLINRQFSINDIKKYISKECLKKIMYFQSKMDVDDKTKS